MNIRKIKYAGGTVTADYTIDNGNVLTETSKNIPHPDFVGKLNNFKEPFMYSLNIERDFKEIKISGFELKETKQGETITITGSFADRKGNFIGVACKAIAYDNEDYEEWNLNAIAYEAIDEAVKYFRNGKQVQTKMEFPDDESDES